MARWRPEMKEVRRRRRTRAVLNVTGGGMRNRLGSIRGAGEAGKFITGDAAAGRG